MILWFLAFDRKMLTLMEEIKHQGQTMILLQQQILNARNNGDADMPATLECLPPAWTN